jgi:hypothetical protein
MNPCELVAKLNPGVARLDGAGGGIPEFTAQDIAAAIGMVSDILAREVFCAVWWADGAMLVWRELDSLIAGLQFGEWRERADQLVTAQIRIAQAPMSDSPAEASARALALLEKARECMWPSLDEEPYRDIRAGVICEMRSARICATCKGRRSVASGGLMVTCGTCLGFGRIAISDSQRALMLKRNESSYRRSWRVVYEWTYKMVADAESVGRAEVLSRLEEAT